MAHDMNRPRGVTKKPKRVRPIIVQAEEEPEDGA
jgi:hypothetical protein